MKNLIEVIEKTSLILSGAIEDYGSLYDMKGIEKIRNYLKNEMDKMKSKMSCYEFIRKCLRKEGIGVTISKSMLHVEYGLWCQENGYEEVEDKKPFDKIIRRVMSPIESTNPEEYVNWEGIKFKYGKKELPVPIEKDDVMVERKKEFEEEEAKRSSLSRGWNSSSDE